MYISYIPQMMKEKRRRAVISSILITAVTLASTGLFLSSRDAHATATHTWSDFAEGTHTNTVGGETLTLRPATSTEDTTTEDFGGGYSPLSNLYTTTQTEEDNGEVILNQGWTYTTNTNPALAVNSLDHSFLNGNLLYVSTWGGGLSVINTQGTEDPTDDTLVTRYHTGSTPALADDDVYHSFLNGNLLYVSTRGGGLSVINTQGTEDPTDDTLVTRYHTGSTPALANNIVFHSFLNGNLLYVSTDNGLSVINTQGTEDPTDDTLVTRYHTGSTPALANNRVYHSFLNGNLLYVSTVGGGLSVINTQGTEDPTDDTLVTRYHTGSTPALANNIVFHSFLNGNLLYVSTDNGLSVINTQGTEDPTDDTLVTRYHTGSTPALANNRVYHSFLNGNLLYVSTVGGGLSVINTQGTEDPTDDTLVTRYHTGSTPALANNSVYGSFLNGNLLYVSTNGDGGLSVINTQGTEDPTDDTLVTRYHTGSTPALANNSVYGSFLNGNLLYVSTDNGLSVINLAGEYNPSATFVGNPRSLNTIPTSTLAIDRIQTSDHTTALSYRIGTSTAVWRDDFNSGTSSYAGDLYGWGAVFQTATNTDGVLTLSNPDDPAGPWLWFDTGFPADHFATGSVITARVRMNTDNVAGDFYDLMGTDKFESGEPFTTTNEWVTLKLISKSALNTIGFEPWLISNFGPEDTWQIDWIQIDTPDSMGEWGAWSPACTTDVCPINPSDLTPNGWIQYRADLSTTNESTTPSIEAVRYQGVFASSGTYVSPTKRFGEPKEVDTFTVDADIPASTTVAYEYTTNEGTTWIPVTPGEEINKTAESFAWRATLTTTDTQVTPTIRSATITFGDAPRTGTSLQRRITYLESQGRLEEAATIRAQWDSLITRGFTPNTADQLIPLLTQLKGLLEELVMVKGGGN